MKESKHTPSGSEVSPPLFQQEMLALGGEETRAPAPYAPVVIPPRPKADVPTEVLAQPMASAAPEVTPGREPEPVFHTLSVTVEPRKNPMSTTPPTVSDYRKNVERQSYEQKSFNRLLAIVGYSLLAAIVLVAGLAGYGGYVMWQQIKTQASTVAQVDAKYQDEIALVRENLAGKQVEIDKLAELVKRQQEITNRLRSTSEETIAALRAERNLRARETEDLRQRLRRVGIQ